MRKAWFCYEATSTGPAPVIHYDSLPNVKNVLNPKILQIHELDYTYFMNHAGNINDEVWTSFSSLMLDFPYTGDEYSKGETFKLPEAAE